MKLPSRTVSPPAPENGAETSAPVNDSKPWYVYMIECHDGSIYTGVAVDVAARYARHASGKGARRWWCGRAAPRKLPPW